MVEGRRVEGDRLVSKSTILRILSESCAHNPIQTYLVSFNLITMNTRAKAAFSTADTLAVAKANCAPKRNPPRSRGGSKPTDSKRKEPATPTPKPKTSDKGSSNLKPAPEKNIEKATLPSSTPGDPKKARKGRQGPGSTPPGISSLKEAVIGGKPKGAPEAANSPRTPPSDNPPVPLLGQQTPSESGDDDEFPDPSKKIDFGPNNLAQSEDSSDSTYKPPSNDDEPTGDEDDDDDDDDVTGFQDASDVEDDAEVPDKESSEDHFEDAQDEEEKDEKKLAEAKEAFNKAVEDGPEEYARLLVTYVQERATILALMEANTDSV